MVFSSLEFLLLFLPAVLVGYYAIRSELRNAWLLVASIAFYAYGEPKFVLVMMASILYFLSNSVNDSACATVRGYPSKIIPLLSFGSCAI